MKNKMVIPKFENMAQEADFWDKNDVTDFLPQMKSVKVKYGPKIVKEESIVVRVQPKMKRLLETVAENEGLPLSTMLRVWFGERLRERYKYER